MTRRSVLVLVVGLTLLGASSTLAQTVEFAELSSSDGISVQPASYANRLAEFEARLETMESLQPRLSSLESQVRRLPSITYQATSFFFGGYDHVIVKPFFSRNFAYWDEAGGPSDFTSFDWDAVYTPRVYIGYQAANGTGVRVRYWSFNGDSTFARTEQPGEDLMLETNLADVETLFVQNGGVDGTIIGRHSIETAVLDFEITKRGDFQWGWLAGSGGVRYVRLDQEAYWFETGGPDFVLVQYNFHGVGPTLALEAGVPIFGSTVSAFANGRGSLLFGERNAFSADLVGPADIVQTYDSLLPIVEAQVGLDCTREILGHVVSLRAAMEAQGWIRGGGASGGDDEGIPADQADLGFFGVSLTTIIQL